MIQNKSTDEKLDEWLDKKSEQEKSDEEAKEKRITINWRFNGTRTR